MNRLVYVMVVVVVVAVCGGGSVTAGRVFRDINPGTCPTITNKEDFDPVPYLGRWFEQERFPVLFQAGMDCVQAIYSANDDGSVEVHNTAREASGEFTDIIGRAEVIAPGVLLVSFPKGVPGEYHVLDTDYQSFSSVYNCVQEGPLKFEYAWILSRTAELDEAKYETARQAFINNGIHLDLFQDTYQGEDCPYLP